MCVFDALALGLCLLDIGVSVSLSEQIRVVLTTLLTVVGAATDEPCPPAPEEEGIH